MLDLNSAWILESLQESSELQGCVSRDVKGLLAYKLGDEGDVSKVASMLSFLEFKWDHISRLSENCNKNSSLLIEGLAVPHYVRSSMQIMSQKYGQLFVIVSGRFVILLPSGGNEDKRDVRNAPGVSCPLQTYKLRISRRVGQKGNLYRIKVVRQMAKDANLFCQP